MDLHYLCKTVSMYRISLVIAVFISLFFTQCESSRHNEQPEERKWEESRNKIDISYHLVSLKDSMGKREFEKYNDNQQQVICAVNRVDKKHISNLDTIIIPDNLDADFIQYSPFPFGLQELRQIKKIIFFSYPAQAFGAYENGHLVRWGPTNMGREHDKTPTGLFYANWKAEETISTVNDEWELKWNFNIENKLGVGWHQYDMPGYPASHSCLRLYENDAKYLFNWAEQWVLEGTDNVKAKGTPAVVFGSYPFGGPKPWWQLAQNGKALNISEQELTALVKPHMQEVLAEQQKQATLKAAK